MRCPAAAGRRVCFCIYSRFAVGAQASSLWGSRASRLRGRDPAGSPQRVRPAADRMPADPTARMAVLQKP